MLHTEETKHTRKRRTLAVKISFSLATAKDAPQVNPASPLPKLDSLNHDRTFRLKGDMFNAQLACHLGQVLERPRPVIQIFKTDMSGQRQALGGNRQGNCMNAIVVDCTK